MTSVISSLHELLGSASEPALRAFARACAEAAVAATGLEGPEVADARQALASGRWESAAQEKALSYVCDRLEREALEADDDIELFNRARAGSSLQEALHRDPLVAARGALEEAAVVFADREQELAHAAAPALEIEGDPYEPDLVEVLASDWLVGLAPMMDRLSEEELRTATRIAVEILAARVPPRHRVVAEAMGALVRDDYGNERLRRRLIKHLPDPCRNEREPEDGALAWVLWNALRPEAQSAAKTAMLGISNHLGHDDPEVPRALARRGLIRLV